MSKGRLEAQIRVPTGGWDFSINDSDAAGAVIGTIPAGTYYLPELIDAFESALNTAAPADTFSVVVSNSETSGTGKVTITSSGNGTLDWDDSELRDLLGYTGSLTLVAATANTATNCARSMWLADCHYDADNAIGTWQGWPVADGSVVESASGQVYARLGQTKTVIKGPRGLHWRQVKRSRAVKANEATTNESFQKFWEDGVWGLASWGTPAGPIRFFPDADAGTYVEYAVNFGNDFSPQQFFDGWAGGPWTVGFDRLIVQSSGTAAAGGRAAITIANLQTSSSTADGTSFTTGAFTPTANKLNVIDIYSCAAVTAEAPSSVVGCGLTWVLVAEKFSSVAGTLRKLSRWRALGSSPTNGALTITFASAHVSVVWSWNEVTGADTSGTNGSGAFVQTVSNSANAALTINNTLVAFEHASNAHLAAVGLNVNDVVTPDPQFVELGEDGEASNVITLETEWALGELTCDPTFPSAQSAIISSEIKAAWA